MNKYTLTALSLAGGFLSGIAWTDWCSGLIILVGFVPFLMIEDYLFGKYKKESSSYVFIYMLPGSIIFSIMTLSWIRAVSILAAVFIILIGSALMTLTIWLFHIARLRAGNMTGYISFVVFWLTLEFLCLKVKILSPWVNLGNALSKDILFVQWYEITGTGGGTLWILLSNLFLFMFIRKMISGEKKKYGYLLLWSSIVILPSVASVIRYYTIKTPSDGKTEVVIVQPDFDPYSEKFKVPFDKQLEKVLKMADTAVSENTSWLVTPETTVDDPVNEARLSDNQYIRMVKDFLRKHPSLTIVTGMVSYSLPETVYNNHYTPDKNNPNNDNLIKYYNSAFKIDTGPDIEIYHKSKLVPGFEYIPSDKLFRPVTKLLPVLGDVNRSYSPQNERTCFSNSSKTQKIAPVICFESIFGQYVADYIKKGAVAIFIITNDGWWINTNAFRQHLHYASLRAIETRRPVIRAANTGISCLINIRGTITKRTGWLKEGILKGTFYPGKEVTPYVKYGDLILKLSVILSIISLFSVFIIIPLLKLFK